jgi:hypothetical protein
MDLDDRLRPTMYAVKNELEGGLALLNMRTGECYELDEIGAALWTSLVKDGRLRSGFEAIVASYDVAPDVLERDILALAGALVAAGLLELNPRDVDV